MEASTSAFLNTRSLMRSGTSICYGYATARAFDRTWGDSRCPAATLHLTGIDTTYFSWHPGSSLNGITYHDIVRFADHAAYVVGISPTITVDQVPGEGLGEQLGVSLSTVIYDQQQGQPTGYYHKKPIYTLLLRNTFHGDDHGGTVQLNTDPEQDSPYTSPPFNWESTESIHAVMNGRTHSGYVQLFNSWKKNGSTYSYSTSTNTTIDTYIFSQPLDHTAFFDRQFNITFVNSLPGETGGQIKVNGVPQNSGFVGHTREQTPAQGITGEAPTQTLDSIEYTFNHWSDGSYQASKTFSPTDDSTFTAYYTAKALAPTSLQQMASVGQNVHLTWTDNSNVNRVTKYHIYRAAPSIPEQKHIVDSVSSGVQSWYDSDVIVKGPRDGPEYVYYVCGVDNQTLSEGYEATVNQFGQPVSARAGAQLASEEGAVLPTQFSVGNYPNPFNPSTTIAFSLVQNSTVKLDIYDVVGRKVRSLVDGNKSAGYYSVVWNGRDESVKQVASGMYLYRFTASPVTGEKAFTQSGKLMLTK